MKQDPELPVIEKICRFIILTALLVLIVMIAFGAEVPVEKEAPKIEGHPLTSVVITQCNLIVAVYVTMPDGRLVRFDKSNGLPVSELLTLAYSATRSERVEISCEPGADPQYETHRPI